MSPNRRVPYLEFLEQKLMEQIIDEAFEVLERTGVLMGNKEGAKLLEDAGMKILKRDGKGGSYLYYPQLGREKSEDCAFFSQTL